MNGWKGIVGHDHLAAWFRRQIQAGRLGHAYLFEGPPGVGKKRMALALAQAVNCALGGQDPCGRCACCEGIRAFSDADLLVLQDIGEGRWVARSEAIGWAGSEERLLTAYAALTDAGFLTPPPPTERGGERWDRVLLAADKLYRKGGDLAPQRALDELADLGGDEVSDAVRRVGRELVQFPRSVVYYRRSLGIDLVTPRARSEELRTVRGFLSRKSLSGRHKIVIVDDAHKMTEEAQNCLLKTLEEPPEHSMLVLILDRAREVLPTIRSRCQVVHFSGIAPDVLAGALVERGFDEAEARWAADRSAGSFAGALASRRDEFLAAREGIMHTWDRVCRGDVPGVLGEIGGLAHEEIADRGARVQRVRDELDNLMLWVRDLLFTARGVPDAFIVNTDLEDVLARESRRLPPDVLERAFWAVADTGQQLGRNVDLRLALEGMVLTLVSEVKGRTGVPA